MTLAEKWQRLTEWHDYEPVIQPFFHASDGSDVPVGEEMAVDIALALVEALGRVRDVRDAARHTPNDYPIYGRLVEALLPREVGR